MFDGTANTNEIKVCWNQRCSRQFVSLWPFLKFLESVFSATFTSRTHWEDKLWELAAHYPIEYLNLSTRSYNGLVRSSYRIRTVADLLKLPLADLKKIRNLGVKSITEIEYAKYRFLEKLEQGKIE